MPIDWKSQLKDFVQHAKDRNPDASPFVDANVSAVSQVVRGLGPDDRTPNAGAGARIVFNMACKHVSEFCRASKINEPRPYKNAYDLKRVETGSRRARVDQVIGEVTTLACKDVLFGALETSGTGIRFYGDMSLVLKIPDEGRPDSWATVQVLDRNSYDLEREPSRSKITEQCKDGSISYLGAAAGELSKWLGEWGASLEQVVAIKVLLALPNANRRWTTGQIAAQVLDDEDYVEVLYPRSFGHSDVHEVRVSAADAAAEADIADREANGEAPGLHELEWRQQRREAKRALAELGVPLRVVTTAGRIKGS